MTEEVVSVQATPNLMDAMELMDRIHVRHLPVVDSENTLVAIVSHRDLFKGALSAVGGMSLEMRKEFLTSTKVQEIMTAEPETAEPGTPIQDAAEQLLEYKLGCLPVTEGGRLVGILTEADFVKHVARSAS